MDIYLRQSWTDKRLNLSRFGINYTVTLNGEDLMEKIWKPDLFFRWVTFISLRASILAGAGSLYVPSDVRPESGRDTDTSTSRYFPRMSQTQQRSLAMVWFPLIKSETSRSEVELPRFIWEPERMTSVLKKSDKLSKTFTI